MSIELVALFLGASIVLYCVLGGADFGAGMLEAFVSKKKTKEQRKILGQALGPVWEANHMWLILAIVILFVGFPKSYSLLSVSFHIPLTIMLIGIVLRGCAYTFRHYDVVKDDSQKYYAFTFMASSFLTPFMLGTVAGGLLLGRATMAVTNFSEGFIWPWWNLFCVSTGVFTCVLFAFLASVYLLSETEDQELRDIFIRRAKILNMMAIVVGVSVFFAAEASDLKLIDLFSTHHISLTMMMGATLLLFPLWMAICKGRMPLARVLVAGQVTAICLGWFRLQFPVLIHRADAEPLTIYNSGAPEATMQMLLYALLVGSFFIFPALYYLLKVFKLSGDERD